MTCILPTAQTVYTGDEDGRVVSPLLRKAKNVVDLLIADRDISTSGIAFNAMMGAKIMRLESERFKDLRLLGAPDRSVGN